MSYFQPDESDKHRFEAQVQVNENLLAENTKLRRQNKIMRETLKEVDESIEQLLQTYDMRGVVFNWLKNVRSLVRHILKKFE